MTGLNTNWVKRGEPGYDAERKRVIWNKRLDKARAPDACPIWKPSAVCVRPDNTDGVS